MQFPLYFLFIHPTKVLIVVIWGCFRVILFCHLYILRYLAVVKAYLLHKKSIFYVGWCSTSYFYRNVFKMWENFMDYIKFLQWLLLGFKSNSLCNVKKNCTNENHHHGSFEWNNKKQFRHKELMIICAKFLSKINIFLVNINFSI